MGNSPATAYMFNNGTVEAEEQLRLLAEILDPHTEYVLDQQEIPQDGNCLEVGGGAGTIAGYLANYVVPAGQVTIIDIDPRHVVLADRVNILTADVLQVDLGASKYDLIHFRLVLLHLRERRELLKRAVAALKPGGALVVSDWDCTGLDRLPRTGTDVQRDAFLAFQTGLIGIGVARGMDPAWALDLPLAFEQASLVDVEAVVHNQFWRGGEPGMQLHGCNSRQLEGPLIEAGVTEPQLQTLRAAMQDPTFTGYTYPMVTAKGRRPR